MQILIHSFLCCKSVVKGVLLEVLINTMYVDTDFVNMFQIKLLQGRRGGDRLTRLLFNDP